jgi:CBS domain-containing protein
LAGFQQDFPVMDGDRLVGIVTHANVLEGLAKLGPDAPVKLVMQRNVPTADPGEPLQGAFERLATANGRALVVVRGGQVIGLITPHHIGEIVTMGKALRNSRAGHTKPPART